jgi:hypothetical protein
MPRKPKRKADRAKRILVAYANPQAKAGPERWISADNLRERVREVTDEHSDLAVALSVDRGWFHGAGRPPHHLQLIE